MHNGMFRAALLSQNAGLWFKKVGNVCRLPAAMLFCVNLILPAQCATAEDLISFSSSVLDGFNESEILPYAISLICPICADVEHVVPEEDSQIANKILKKLKK